MFFKKEVPKELIENVLMGIIEDIPKAKQLIRSLIEEYSIEITSSPHEYS
ncbi:MAG TPA: hypothetical protein GXX58_11180 [Gelria sp.]|jgi:hypothetical protein|nr:hypothetical protein [Gelria sp.]